MAILLEDNQPEIKSLKDGRLLTELTDEERAVLRFLSSHSIKNLKDGKNDSVLVYPHSFKETQGGFADSYVLQYAESIDGVPERISTGNIVGFIGYKGADIRIRSRFSEDDYFLYYMMERVMSMNLVNFKTSTTRTDKDAILDLMFLFFPKLLKEALAQGVYKQYVYHEYNDANVKGAIDINRHIRYNIPFNGRIAYRTREFSYDNPITQLIRHTIEFIRRKPFGQSMLHNDVETESCTQQIILATPTYSERQRQAVINDNLRPFAHPYFSKYTALIKLCLSILRHERLFYGNNKDEQVYGLLIDAAWLWEEYVAKVLAENGSGLKHFTNKKRDFYLFEKEENGKKYRIQQIIPDYLDETNHIVADAKYIPLLNDKLSAAQAAPVYYKTIMYMYRFDAKKGFLFHPVSKKKDEETGEIVAVGDEPYVENDYTIEDRPDCHLYKVGLVVADNAIKESVDKKTLDVWRQFNNTMNDREKAFVKRVVEIIEKHNAS